MTSDQTQNKSVITQAIDAYWEVVRSAEFKELMRQRERARHNEASALYNAEMRGENRANEKWQSVVVEKDEALARKDEALARKDEALARKDEALAEKDDALAEKDRLIAKLRAELDSKGQ